MLKLLVIDSKHIKDQQDLADDFNNYFSSTFYKISKNNVDNMINDELLYTFYYYLVQNLWFLKLFQLKKLHL
jgi:ATP:corrinoid adenosyltransferase